MTVDVEAPIRASDVKTPLEKATLKLEGQAERFEDALAQLVQQTTSPGGVILSRESHSLVDSFLLKDPESLKAWLALRAHRLVGSEAQSRATSLRRYQRVATRRSAFDGMLESGRVDAGLLYQSFVVRDDYLRKPLMEMTQDDCLYVVDSRHPQIHAELVQVSVLAHVASKLGERTVGQVFSEEELERLYELKSKAVDTELTKTLSRLAK